MSILLILTSPPTDTDQPADFRTGTIPDTMIVLPDGILVTATIIDSVKKLLMYNLISGHS